MINICVPPLEHYMAEKLVEWSGLTYLQLRSFEFFFLPFLSILFTAFNSNYSINN